jgi:epoxyqueuosine reductase QueG
VAVALGNALAAVSSDDQAQPLLAALQQHADSSSALVQEHAQWALAQWSVRG